MKRDHIRKMFEYAIRVKMHTNIYALSFKEPWFHMHWGCDLGAQTCLIVPAVDFTTVPVLLSTRGGHDPVSAPFVPDGWCTIMRAAGRTHYLYKDGRDVMERTGALAAIWGEQEDTVL